MDGLADLGGLYYRDESAEGSENGMPTSSDPVASFRKLMYELEL